jgi:hypothetical protein
MPISARGILATIAASAGQNGKFSKVGTVFFFLSRPLHYHHMVILYLHMVIMVILYLHMVIIVILYLRMVIMVVLYLHMVIMVILYLHMVIMVILLSSYGDNAGVDLRKKTTI